AATACRSWLLLQLVRVGRGQGEAVDRLELVDLGEDGRPEGHLALEGVQDDAFDEVTEGQVEVFGQALEDFQRVALDAKAGLHSLNCYHGNKITSVTALGQAGRGERPPGTLVGRVGRARREPVPAGNVAPAGRRARADRPHLPPTWTSACSAGTPREETAGSA